MSLLLACCLALVQEKGGSLRTPNLVRVFTFGSPRGGLQKRVVVGTRQGGIYGLDPTSKRETFEVRPLVESPVTAIAEAWDGRYTWSVAGSSDLYLQLNGQTGRIDSGLHSPIIRLDNWGDYLVAQGQGEARFLDLKNQKSLTPEQFFSRDRTPEFDIPTAISQGPCLFAWDRNGGTVVSVARLGKLQNPREEGGTTDLSYVRSWRVDRRQQAKFLGGYFAPLTPFDDVDGENVIHLGSRTYSGPRGTSRLSNFAVTREGVVAITQRQVRALPFQKKNWDADEPIELPVAANYPTSVSGSGNSVWYADGSRIFQYSVDSDGLAVFVRTAKGTILSVVGDESGAWVVTDAGVDRLSTSDPVAVAKAGYVQVTLKGEAPAFGKDRRALKQALEAPLALPASNDPTVWGAIKQSKIKPRTDLTPRTTGTLNYGDIITQGATKGFFVGDMQVRRWADGAWTNSNLDITKPFSFVRVCREDPPRFRPSTVPWDPNDPLPIAPIPIGKNGLEWQPGSKFDKPYRPAHQVMKSTIDSWLGTPYLWAGNSRDGIDCSGFVHMVFQRAGISIPRQSQAIRWYRKGSYPTDQLKWGDVIAIDGHVLMYAGNGKTAESLGGVGVTYGTVAWYTNGTVRRFIP